VGEAMWISVEKGAMTQQNENSVDKHSPWLPDMHNLSTDQILRLVIENRTLEKKG